MADQVRIKFGPARYKTEKGIRRQIEDSKTETEESTIDKITGGAGLGEGGVGAGADYREGYINGNSINGLDGTVEPSYTNATGQALLNGDKVLYAVNSDGTVYVVAILERSGGILIDQPVVAISPNFPLQTDTLPFPMRYDGRFDIAFDAAGHTPYGADAIIAWNSVTPTAGSSNLNAFSRTSSASVSLSVAPGANLNNVYVTPNGRIILTPDGGTFYYRDAGASTWASYSPAGSGSAAHAFDPTTGAFWAVKSFTTLTFTRFLDSDAAPVNAGSMGITFSNPSPRDVEMYADHGTVSFHCDYFGFWWQKPSDDTTNFTSRPGYSSASWAGRNKATSLTPSGDLGYMRDDLITNTIHIRKLTTSGAVIDTDTGVPLSDFYSSNGELHYASSGVAVMGLSGLDTYFGGTVGALMPVVAVNNNVTTTYVYYDPINLAANVFEFTVMQEVTPGNIRFGLENQDTLEYKVYELTGF